MGNDLELYDRRAGAWWGEGERFFRSLKSVKAFHLDLLRQEWSGALRGATLVDLGCGGGLLALPLVELGASVVALDLSRGSLAAGRAEARRRGLRVGFLRADLRRTPLGAGCADLVVLSDVLEHVARPRAAMGEASRLLRAGGRLFVNTFDRTRASALVVVRLAEGLGLVPRGTHDPRLFVRPGELEGYGRTAGLRRERLVYERPRLLPTFFTWTVHLREASRGFGYSMFFTKESPCPGDPASASSR